MTEEFCFRRLLDAAQPGGRARFSLACGRRLYIVAFGQQRQEKKERQRQWQR